MFKKWKDPSVAEKDNHRSYPFRQCALYISTKNKQILFVPYGKMDIGAFAEAVVRLSLAFLNLVKRN
jgi:hypothetical protein